MQTLIIMALGTAALLSLAGAIGLLALGQNGFAARIGVRGRDAAPLVERMKPRVMKTLKDVGEVAGRGALSGTDRASLRSRLVRAGFYADGGVEAFYAVRALAALGLAIAALALSLATPHTGSLHMMLAAFGGAFVGLWAPNVWLSQRIRTRERAIRIGLPDALDLMVVCVEAGAGFASAIQRVEAEFRELHPVLAEHFRIVMLETQAGASRAEALERLAQRAATDEIREFVTMIIQSESLGASIGQTLRVLAQQIRAARFLDAERRAAELPVKMALPLVLCIFPALLTVIFTPIIIRFIRVLFKV